MPKTLSAVILVLIFSASPLGCARRTACVKCDGSPLAAATAPMPTETRTDRGDLEPDTTRLASYDEVDRALSASPSPIGYRVLLAIESQCLAASNAPIANAPTDLT